MYVLLIFEIRNIVVANQQLLLLNVSAIYFDSILLVRIIN